MKFSVGDAVVSTAGHDAGKMFLVVGTEDAFAWICDGKNRKVEKPKKKKFRHLVSAGARSDEAAEKIRQRTLHNKDVRRLICEISKKDEE
ncbi:MAG: RNA-binding protein [Clostridia bacterium]|nr:RNA-binding protein [Clostridia bacterium]